MSVNYFLKCPRFHISHSLIFALITARAHLQMQPRPMLGQYRAIDHFINFY